MKKVFALVSVLILTGCNFATVELIYLILSNLKISPYLTRNASDLDDETCILKGEKLRFVWTEWCEAHGGEVEWEE
jgi:hypothetical protein